MFRNITFALRMKNYKDFEQVNPHQELTLQWESFTSWFDGLMLYFLYHESWFMRNAWKLSHNAWWKSPKDFAPWALMKVRLRDLSALHVMLLSYSPSAAAPIVKCNYEAAHWTSLSNLHNNRPHVYKTWDLQKQNQTYVFQKKNSYLFNASSAAETKESKIYQINKNTIRHLKLIQNNFFFFFILFFLRSS